MQSNNGLHPCFAYKDTDPISQSGNSVFFSQLTNCPKDLAKDSDNLIPMEEGPYYIAWLDLSNLIGVGGIGSNRKFEAIDPNFNTIPGLYVAGMDSTMQYRNVYTITLGGSACAHNVNSGRHAAMNAKDYIASLR